MATHTPTRWVTFLIALMMLVAAACTGVEAATDDGSGAGHPPTEEPDEGPGDPPAPVPVIPDCPSRIPGTFC